MQSIVLLFAGLSFGIGIFFLLFPIPNTKHTKKTIVAAQITPKPTVYSLDNQPLETIITQEITEIPTAMPTSQSQATNASTPPTSTPQQQTIMLTISEPNGTTSNAITLNGDQTPCSILQETKNEGKIKSLTIQNYPSMHSDYVQEMNGYQNSWNFMLNGTKEPTGCSNYHLKQNDNVTWKFD
ncbi:MAG TPA: DUF4430 domain-containing protein [Patescibacteria group bacterium]